MEGYEGDLLASSKGRLNLPMRIGGGLTYQPNEKLKVGFDILRINWQDTEGFGQGTAFNWDDQTVYRVAVDYKANAVSSIRFGYSHATAF